MLKFEFLNKNLDRQKRSPANHYSNFFADRYSDLESIEDNHEYKNDGDEISESSEDEAGDEVDSSEHDFTGRK